MASCHSRRIGALALTLAALLGAACGSADPSLAISCDLYGARDGSDRNPGTVSQPFASPQRLAEALSPGQTGCLRSGTYSQTAGDDYVLDFEDGGREGAPITIRSAPGHRARLRGTIHVRDSADHVTLTRLAIEGTAAANAVKVYASDFTLSESDLTNARRRYSCLMLGSQEAGTALRPVIRRNFIHDCGSPASGNKDHAIYASEVRDGEIVENLIVNPAAWAVHLYPNTHGTRVLRNVIDSVAAVRGGLVVAGNDEGASSSNLIEGNIISFPGTYGIDTNFNGRVGTGNLVRRNCIWRPGERAIASLVGAVARDNLIADPQFVDRGRRDYRLRAGSGCRPVIGVDVAAELARTGFGPRAVKRRGARRQRSGA